jgi:cobalt/nickel transport system permease protein
VGGVSNGPERRVGLRVGPRLWLVAYLCAVTAATLVHRPDVLAAALLAAVTAAGPLRWRLLRRTVQAIVGFNLTVSLGYAALTLWRGGFSPDYLLLVNLRVIFMVFLGFWFVARVDVLAALRGRPTLTLVATLALGQIRSLERVVADFRAAFESRNIRRPRLAARARHAAAQGVALMDKADACATESALALRSRGVFDD